MIADTIKSQLVEALKAKDKDMLIVLRMLSTELHNKEIDKKGSLTNEEEIAVVRAQAKMRRDAIEAYDKANAKDKADAERRELEILKGLMPAEMGDDELVKIVDGAIIETNASSVADIGKVIGLVMKKSNGKASGARVSEVVKSKLQ